MTPKNFTERRKRILTFAGFYAASVILIFFIFSAFGVRLSVSDQQVNTSAGDFGPETASSEILSSDSLLHIGLRKLQQSDDEYMLLLTNSATVPEINEAFASVTANESLFRKDIDSIDQLTADYSGEKALTYKTMVNSFKSILNNRLAVNNIQASIASGKTMLTGGQQEMLQWKNELNQKDNELARMAEELKLLQGRSFVPVKSAGAAEAQQGEIELLKTAFNDKQQDYEALKDKFSQMKAENNIMAIQISEFKKSALMQAENSKGVAEEKIRFMEQKMQNLNADLYFARVDCNLARADASQIISNARQRKELLSESLSVLNNLSKSEDFAIQKKAKEKIIRLNRIATTLHD